MAIVQFCKRSSVALLVMSSMASLATPMVSLGQAVASSQGKGDAVGSALEQINGNAVGTITMPTLTELGILVAVGQSEQGRVFMLDAELTSAVPSLFDPHTRVAFGGVYGELFESPVGGVGGEQAAFEGVVEGMWRMDKSLEGSYEALVYEREGRGGLKLVGRIAGLFRVSAMEDAVQGPVIDDAMDSKKEFATPFMHARSRLVPYGDDVIIVGGPKNANDHLGDAGSSKSGDAAAVGGSPFDAHHDAKDVRYSGATKLEFKILD